MKGNEYIPLYMTQRKTQLKIPENSNKSNYFWYFDFK